MTKNEQEEVPNILLVCQIVAKYRNDPNGYGVISPESWIETQVDILTRLEKSEFIRLASMEVKK
jgi:hypothetical protein